MKDLKPSTEQSWNSGGTAGELVAERKKASFEVRRCCCCLMYGCVRLRVSARVLVLLCLVHVCVRVSLCVRVSFVFLHDL